MAKFNNDYVLAGACLKAGDWRGAICWLEDARDQAEKLGMPGRARECDAFLAAIEIRVRGIAAERGITLAQLASVR
jgi:hypothetical protein